ncbi:TraK family protein [Rahnella perminowiae]|uniref:TraK family protein n=1 Tax=Rahnella perminowiae TaxID=2816244 RepID=UPI00215C6C67|nr:TraK family protein [Rahnella perminowiae]MCR8998666.1 TraK family protein [Rahnella perminowiae]MCR8998724.1 TraK family protein [Rahnella perminowiae]
MTDWRSKPRNGRTEFIKHSDEIQSQLKSGKTNTQIYTWLSEREDFPLSLSQFNRYVRKYFFDVIENVRVTEERKTSLPKKDLTVSDEIKSNQLSSKYIKSSLSEWHNINVRTQRLINDLEENGFSPEEVSSWNEPNDTAIRNRLTQITLKKGK